MTESLPTNPDRDPQKKGGTAQAGDASGADRDTPDEQRGGEVSEVGGLDGAGEPVSDDQSVAGSPSDESGRPDEGPTGPNSRAGSDSN